jgi:cyclic-di-GMP phosphodiesterase TipF (flagellum assembly factor)
VVGEINELGVLVKELAVSVAGHEDMLSSGVPPATPPAPKPEDAPPKEPPAVAAVEEKSVVVVAAAPVKIVEGPAPSRSQAQILTAVKNAMEENRIDIYLQPMVTLPQRKVRFYEAVTRLRDDKDQILSADDFIGVAEAAGLIGRIDHMVMLRCVQVLRRLMVRNKDVGVFCNVAAATLGNPTTFAQCLDFLEANRALAPSLVLHQGARLAAARPEANLGVRYSSIRPFRSARPLRHRPDRRTDRRRTRRGRSARL